MIPVHAFGSVDIVRPIGAERRSGFGVGPARTIRQAAGCLLVLNGFINSMPIEEIHLGTLQPYLAARKNLGVKSEPDSRELAELLNAVEKIPETESGKNPAFTLIKKMMEITRQ